MKEEAKSPIVVLIPVDPGADLRPEVEWWEQGVVCVCVGGVRLQIHHQCH